MKNISNQAGMAKRKQLVILMAVVVFLLFVTTRYWPAQQGVVLDEATGKPLPGVFVIARYSGDIPAIADYQTVCYHAAGTVTNEQGEYRLPSRFDTPGILVDKQVELDFFKQGYRHVYYKNGVAKLKKDESNREARFKELERVARNSGCDGAGYSQRQLVDYTKAVFYEARELSKSTEDVKKLDWFRRIVGRNAVALDDDQGQSWEDLESLGEEYSKKNLK